MIQATEFGSGVDAPLQTPSQCPLENDALVEFAVDLCHRRFRLVSTDAETLEFPHRPTPPVHLHVRRTVGIGDRCAMVVQRSLAPQSSQDRFNLAITEPFSPKPIFHVLGRQLATRQHGQRCEIRVR